MPGVKHKKMHKSLRRLPLRILWAAVYRIADGQRLPPHECDVWELIYSVSDQVIFSADGTKRVLETGAFLLVPPRTSRSVTAETEHVYYSIGIAAPARQHWRAKYQDDPQRSVQRLCDQVIAEFATKRARRGAMLDLLAQQIHIVLERLTVDATLPPVESAVREVESLTHQNHGRGIDVAKIARLANTTPATLRRHFAQLRGGSPLEFLQKTRLTHALHLLAHTNLTLADIAAACGYHSASHLSRGVKAAKGKSPGRLRKKLATE